MNYQYTFYTIITVLVLAIGAWIYQDIYVYGQRKSELRAEIIRLDQKFKELSDVRNTYDQVKRAFDNKVASLDTLRGRVTVDNKEFLELINSIRELAVQNNINVPTIQPTLEDSYPAIKTGLKLTDKYIVRYIVQLTLRGDYLSIGQFLEKLVNHPKLFNIGRLSMDTEIETPGVLSCRLVLYSYMLKGV